MFNINEFKSVMNKYGGPAKSNLFVVSLSTGRVQSRKTNFILKEDLRFFCTDVTVPPLNVNVASYNANVIDMPQTLPINMTAPQINAAFMLDSDHKVLSFFHSWMQEIINYDVSGGYLSQINDDHMPYEIGYKSDYACDLIIRHFKTDAKNDSITEAYEYYFFDAYPTEIGGKTLSWAPSDSFSTFTVNFSASSFSYSASDPGRIVSSVTRGNGLLDFLNSVGYRGQTIQQRILPTSVQDAINSFTRVQSDFRQFRNSLQSLRNIV